MDTKTKVYVDSSAFVAALDRSDTYHTLFAQLFSTPPPLITSPLVISETQGWFLKRYDSIRALQFLSFIEKLSPLSIQTVGVVELEKAYEILREFSDQSLTLVDAMGLVFLKSYKIKSCWSTDRHLGLTGIPLVIYEMS